MSSRCWTRACGAQVTTGTLVGTVRDANGVVPGASVTIREVNRGTSNTYVTDESGSYTAPFLSPGTYTVEVNVQGFRSGVREGVILQVNQRARVDVTLEVGGIEETTTVVAEAPLLQDRFVRGRHGHRGAGDQGAAAERPQLRDAGLPDARHHARPGRTRTCRAPARSTRAAPRTSTRSATRPTPTPG